MEISYTKANPKAVFREVHITAIPIAALIWVLFMVVFRDWHSHGAGSLYNPSPIVAVGLGWIVALALSLQITLFRRNRSRLRAVLRPTIGRVLAAALIGGLTPFIIFDWIPWIAIGLGLFGLSISPSEPSWTILGAFGLAAVWYVPSSLIISGVTAKKWRFALFSLMWWACYAGLILAMGVLHFLI